MKYISAIHNRERRMELISGMFLTLGVYLLIHIISTEVAGKEDMVKNIILYWTAISSFILAIAAYLYGLSLYMERIIKGKRAR